MVQGKHLHGMYHCKAYKVANVTKSYHWLKKAGLKLVGTEALVMAAQEQALITRLIEAGICHTRQDSRCGYCSEAAEIQSGAYQQVGRCLSNKWQAIVQAHICVGQRTPLSCAIMSIYEGLKWCSAFITQVPTILMLNKQKQSRVVYSK